MVAASVVALFTMAYAAARAVHEPAWATDFDQLWHAARALTTGGNPYDVVGPGKAFQWDWPLYYPLPAVVLAAPFAWMPVALARVAFSTISGAVLGYALGPRLRTHWPLLLSAAYLIATSRTQWAPLLLATMWLPWAGVAIAAKPNVGLAILAALRGRRLVYAIIAAAAVTLLATGIHPQWIAEWHASIAHAPHIRAPLFMPWGFLLALAAMRWRRPDARLLLGMAVLPHTPSLYDLLPLFFLARTLRESLALAVLTHLLFFGFIAFSGGPTFDAYAAALGRASILVVYLPALAAVLARPNVGDDLAQSSDLRRSGLEWIPATRADAWLSLALMVGAAFLFWLPLATRR
ncbi:MAG: hypothetical protein AMXMBFR55_33620 [Gemmatimonadota bacterium]